MKRNRTRRQGNILLAAILGHKYRRTNADRRLQRGGNHGVEIVKRKNIHLTAQYQRTNAGQRPQRVGSHSVVIIKK